MPTLKFYFASAVLALALCSGCKRRSEAGLSCASTDDCVDELVCSSNKCVKAVEDAAPKDPEAMTSDEIAEEQGRIRRTLLILREVRQALDLHYVKFDEHPASLMEMAPGGRAEPPLIPRTFIRDGWGRHLEYRLRDGSIELFSKGRDHEEGTEDDIHAPEK